MSARVMSCLEELAPRVEQYSIDEMFLDLTGVEHCMDLEDFGRQLRQHVYDCTRLTIGVGAGPTKTLAKSAQWASKEWKQFRGVLALTRGILSERGNCFHCSRSKRSGAWETVLHANLMYWVSGPRSIWP
jgi:nucleotidyltransferase/DNA polymerase involved in DNA repair